MHIISGVVGEERIRGVINLEVRAAEDSCCYTRLGRRNRRHNPAPNPRQLLHITKEEAQGVKPCFIFKLGICIYCG